MNVVDVIQLSFILVVFSIIPLASVWVILSIAKQQWYGWKNSWDVIAITLFFATLFVTTSIFGAIYAKESITRPSMSAMHELCDGSICYEDSSRMCPMDNHRFFKSILLPGENTSRNDVCIRCNKTFRMHNTKNDLAALDWCWYAPWE